MGGIIKLRVVDEVPIEAKDTDTIGDFDFLVATLCGGIPEDPEFHYESYQVIHADTKEQAVKMYNTLNKCNYYYGECIGMINMYGKVYPV